MSASVKEEPRQDPDELLSVAQSYRHCRRVARRAASNFYWSFWLLPQAQRHAMCALYAFSRRTDDLADSRQPVAERRQALQHWRHNVQQALAGRCHDPLLPALADTVQRYAVPHRYLFELIDGVAMDLEPCRYETFEQLRHYCYHVASAVGLACLHIWGFQKGPEPPEPAITCGIAFQMTNILRDLHEDAQQGRIYLPLEELDRFGYTTEDLLHSVRNQQFAALMQFQIARTQILYRQAEATGRYLQGNGRRVFGMMFTTYRSLLEEIQRRNGDVFSRPVRLGWTRKLAIAACYALPAMTSYK